MEVVSMVAKVTPDKREISAKSYTSNKQRCYLLAKQLGRKNKLKELDYNIPNREGLGF